jgi:hypothetical protein
MASRVREKRKSSLGRARWSLALSVLGLACSEGSPAPSEGEPGPSLVCDAGSVETAPNPLRRLTRFEYGRTVQDLTGVESSIASTLPPDEESLGFLNIADAYSVSTLHATKYLEIAEKIADRLAISGERLTAFAGCDPVSDAACVEPFVKSFGQRAYRRPVEAAELSSMVALFEATSRGEPRDGLRAVVATMLQSPQFLYRPEPAPIPTPETAETRLVDPYVLATRLSYLLTASAPDEALLARAGDGSLVTDAGLEAEANRLLESPRALEAFTHFLHQWWELGTLPAVEKDRRLFRTWSSDLPAAFAEELRLFVADAWQSQPTLETLLGAPYTFADASLASFYGYPVPAGAGFQKILLDPARASGILTQGALLATHAKADQTSPIHRGKFVRARLFCTPPPPPPPTIIVRPPSVNPRLSTRERFQQHVADASCAGCHQLMDPIGFAFENYDATGRYRETDAEKPVDASGELLGTDVDGTFDSVPELAERLLESEQVRDCVATQWFRYAFGRSEQSEADTCAIGVLSDELRRERGDLRAMMRATVKQPLFRRTPSAEVEP